MEAKTGDYFCRWHEYPWVACNYCEAHRTADVLYCSPNESCVICDQSTLWDDPDPNPSTGRLIGHNQAGAVRIRTILFWMFVSLCVLISAPFVAMILIAILGEEV